MLSEHERYHGLGMDALVYARGTRTFFWFGHGRAIYGMLSEHERYYGLGMVALFIVCSVSVCFRNTNIIMVWAWMRDSMLSEHERYYRVGMDALAFAFAFPISGPRNTSNVWFVPRRPHPERSARCACFARLGSGGANINNDKKSTIVVIITAV